MERKVYVTPDYLEVRPLGSCGGGGTIGETPIPPSYLDESQREALKQELLGIVSGSVADINARMEQLRHRLDEGDITDLDLKRILDLANADIKTLRLKVESINQNGQAGSSQDLIAVTTDDAALAQAIQQVNAKFRDMVASYNSIVQSYTSADQALSQRLDQVKAEIAGSDIAAKVAKDVMAQVNNKYALVSDVNILRAKFNDVDTKINEAKQAASSAQSSVVRIERTINQTVGDYVATHTQGLSSQITRNSNNITNIQRTYTNLMTDSYGNIVGYKFGDNGTSRKFEISADDFKISSSNQKLTPFEIKNGKIRFTGNVDFDQILQRGTVVRTRTYRKQGLVYINPHTEVSSWNPDEQYAVIFIESFEDPARTKYRNDVSITDKDAAYHLSGAPANVPFFIGVITIFYYRDT